MNDELTGTQNSNENIETDYDALQMLFLNMNYTIEEDHLMELIQEADLKFAISEGKETKRRIITIANTQEDADAGFMDCDGDCLAISYMRKIGSQMLEDVSYIKNGNKEKVAVYRYHYDAENKRYGYTYLFYDASGNFTGILLNGQNSNMFPCENAEDALGRVLKES